MSVFSKPYPVTESLKSKLITAILFGIFIFGFLVLFQPFGLYIWKDPQKLIKIGGYGLVTTLTILFHALLLPFVFPKYYEESNWTVLKEIVQLVLIVISIAILNTVYSHLIGLIRLNTNGFINFGLITIIVSIIPVTAMIIINNYRLQVMNAKKAHELSQKLLQNVADDKMPAIKVAEITMDEFTIGSNKFLFAQASDNYIEVHFLVDGGEVNREVIRHTLKELTEQTSQLPSFFRCHRSYLVNMDFVNHVTGNSQGQKLHLQYVEELIPVSRSLNKELEKRLSALDPLV